jgi:hypothetical protein
MKTYTDESQAYNAMRDLNRAMVAADNTRDLLVLVDGPEDGQWTVMELKEAIAGEFTYRWAS